MSYLAEKYAHLLSKDDVIDLFTQLEAMFKGNLSEACRKCGIQRKTKYDWDCASSLKLSTKKKILEAMIRIDPEKALDFLFSHSKEISVELLSTYISHIYSKTMSENIDPRNFVKYAQEFEKVKKENAGLIWEIEEEIGEMTYNVMEKAKVLRVRIPVSHLETINPNYLIEVVPSVVDAILRRGDKGFSELSSDLRVPERLVSALHQAIMIPTHGVQPIETTQNELEYDVAALSPTTEVEYSHAQDGSSPWIV